MHIDTYPTPTEDHDNRPFLNGWEKGKLLVQHCEDCKRAFFYPRPMCPYCWSTNFRWSECVGRGSIVSYSKVFRPNHSAFNDEVPILLAEVKLVDGFDLLTRITDCDPDNLKIGATVRLRTDGAEKRLPLPVFVCD